MNNLPSHLTTDPASGVMASGYQSWRYSDAPKVYYTPDYVANMRWFHDRARKARSGDVGAAAITDAMNTRKRRRGTKSGTCVVCGDPFINGERDQVTCLSAECLAERQRQRRRESKERQKRRAVAA